MPLYVFYIMMQKSQKWPKTQIKGGPALNFSYTPIDAHTHLPVLYFVNSTNLDLIQTAHTAPQSGTRSQLTPFSLCIPNAARRPGTISPLFTSV